MLLPAYAIRCRCSVCHADAAYEMRDMPMRAMMLPLLLPVEIYVITTLLLSFTRIDAISHTHCHTQLSLSHVTIIAASLICRHSSILADYFMPRFRHAAAAIAAILWRAAHYASVTTLLAIYAITRYQPLPLTPLMPLIRELPPSATPRQAPRAARMSAVITCHAPSFADIAASPPPLLTSRRPVMPRHSYAEVCRRATCCAAAPAYAMLSAVIAAMPDRALL